MVGTRDGAAWLARWAHNPKVAGSNPAPASNSSTSFHTAPALLRYNLSMPSLSYEQKFSLLRQVLGPMVFVMDLFDDRVVVEPYGEDPVSVDGMSETLESGKLYEIKYAIDDKGEVTLSGKPKTVRREIVYKPAKYSAEFAYSGLDGETVVRKGKIFEAAVYEDKGMEISEAELDEMVSAFTPVPVNVEHAQSPFDGKLGFLTAIWRVGRDLFGSVAIPEWLEKPFRGEPLKTSVEISRADKRITGIAICNNPRVTDAAIMAAFKVSEEGRRRPAKETGDNTHKMTWIQKLREWHRTGQWPQDMSKELKDAGFSDEDASDIEKAVAYAKANPEQKPDVVKTADSTAPVDALRNQLEANNAAYTAQLQAMESKALSDEADKFVAKYIAEKKMLPGEAASMKELFVSSARDDAAASETKACFNAAGELVRGTRVNALEKMVGDRPVFFAAQPIHVKGEGDAAKMSEDRMKSLLGMGHLRINVGGN